MLIHACYKFMNLRLNAKGGEGAKGSRIKVSTEERRRRRRSGKCPRNAENACEILKWEQKGTKDDGTTAPLMMRHSYIET